MPGYQFPLRRGASLALFDRLFGLPAAQLQVVSSLAGSNGPYRAAAAEVRDVEIVHAVAPDAVIRVVLAGATVSSQLAALQLGITSGEVLLISVSVGEHCLTGPEVTAVNSALQAAESRHVTVVNSTGEFGASAMPCPGATAITPVKGVALPAADPLVLASGGVSASILPVPPTRTVSPGSGRSGAYPMCPPMPMPPSARRSPSPAAARGTWSTRRAEPLPRP